MKKGFAGSFFLKEEKGGVKYLLFSFSVVIVLGLIWICAVFVF